MPVDHYVQVDFEGLVGMVESLGGVEVAVDRPLRDPSTGLDIQPSACTTLDGPTMLALLRSRHIEGDPYADLGRVARQRSVLAAVAAQAHRRDFNLPTVDALARQAADYLTVDVDLTVRTMVDLAWSLLGSDTGDIDARTVPVATAPQDPDRLVLAPEAAAVLAEFGAPAGTRAGPGGTDKTAGQRAPDEPDQLDLAAIGNGGIGPCPGS